MTRSTLLSCSAVALLAAALGPRSPAADQPAPKAPAKVQYAWEILPILAANCFTCHGPDAKTRKAGLRLDVAQEATKELKSGARAIVPGNSKDSELVVRILATDGDRMPPPKSQHQLKEREKELLKRWIEEGAEYQPHWA